MPKPRQEDKTHQRAYIDQSQGLLIDSIYGTPQAVNLPCGYTAIRYRDCYKCVTLSYSYTFDSDFFRFRLHAPETSKPGADPKTLVLQGASSSFRYVQRSAWLARGEHHVITTPKHYPNRPTGPTQNALLMWNMRECM